MEELTKLGAPNTMLYINFLESEITTKDHTIGVLLQQVKIQDSSCLTTPKRPPPRPATLAPRKDIQKLLKPKSGKRILVCTDGKRPRKKECQRDPLACNVGNCKWFDESGKMSDHFVKSHPNIVYNPEKHSKVIYGISEQERKERRKSHRAAFKVPKTV